MLSASSINTINIQAHKTNSEKYYVYVPDFTLPTTKYISASIITTKKPDLPKTKDISQSHPETSWQEVFNSMKSRLPGTYIISDKGSWGATDLSNGIVYIAPRTPLKYLDDVMLHESIHVRQGRIYGDIDTARSALAPFGGLEPVADCGAKMLGATWTNYVSSCTANMNHAARAMLDGVLA